MNLNVVRTGWCVREGRRCPVGRTLVAACYEWFFRHRRRHQVYLSQILSFCTWDSQNIGVHSSICFLLCRSFNAVIDACSKAGDAARAEHWLQGAIRDFFLKFWQTLAEQSGYYSSRRHGINTPRGIISGFNAPRLQPRVFTQLHVACGVVGALGFPIGCAVSTQPGGVKTSSASTHLFSSFYFICKNMLAMVRGGVAADVISYTAVINACAQVGAADKVSKAFSHQNKKQ